tara:strand:+ start:21551 stop:21763 length:213 start_codon:yes stop_codon:yes gene_type:complete
VPEVIFDVDDLKPILIEPAPQLAGLTWRFSKKMRPVYKALKKIHAVGKYSTEKKRFLSQAREGAGLGAAM